MNPGTLVKISSIKRSQTTIQRPEKLEVAGKMLEEAEKCRLESMSQFEADGLPPFMRNRAALIES
jgi:hypothetical protein